MNTYVVQVQVMGDTFYFKVPSKEEAEKSIRKIKNEGYRHFDGNPVREFTARQIVNVSYIRIRI